jgi:hypothetical protein
MRKSILITLIIFSITHSSFGQSNKDTLYFKNANRIIGEIKSLDRGVIIVETDYSDNDFAIEWIKVDSIKAGTRFLITLKDGFRFNGTLVSTGDSGKVLLKGKRSPNAEEEIIESNLPDIVYLKGLSSKFWSRAYANIDFGLSLTRANNLRQFSGRTKLGYLADKWQADFYYDAMRSKQDSVEATNRQEINFGFNYFLPKDWLVGAGVNFLTNTEQALKLRTTGKLGMGKFLIHTNKHYWKATGGLSFNNENFSNNTVSRSSLEGFVGSEVNLFDIGDLNLFNSIYVYPSFTESGRWRSDIKLDLKYDLPRDFYIRFGATLNYDNRPAVVGKETDYVLNFSVGWEL